MYSLVGDIKKTCQAVESYLLFLPADETMVDNKEYYRNLPKVQENYFVPRPVSHSNFYIFIWVCE